MQPNEESTRSNAVVLERQRLDVALDPLDLDARGGGACPRGGEVLRREVDAGDAPARQRGGDRDVAGAAGDVEDGGAGRGRRRARRGARRPRRRAVRTPRSRRPPTSRAGPACGPSALRSWARRSRIARALPSPARAILRARRRWPEPATQSRPRRCASATAAARDEQRSFAWMLATWRWTVCSLSVSSARDLAVAEALGDEPQHLDLARAELAARRRAEPPRDLASPAGTPARRRSRASASTAAAASRRAASLRPERGERLGEPEPRAGGLERRLAARVALDRRLVARRAPSRGRPPRRRRGPRSSSPRRAAARSSSASAIARSSAAASAAAPSPRRGGARAHEQLERAGARRRRGRRPQQPLRAVARRRRRRRRRAPPRRGRAARAGRARRRRTARAPRRSGPGAAAARPAGRRRPSATPAASRSAPPARRSARGRRPPSRRASTAPRRNGRGTRP